MTYFATVKHHSTVGYWEKLSAKTLAVAKREATKEFGGGYNDHVIHLVECSNEIDEQRLNDLPAHTKMIGGGKWQAPY